MDKKALFTSAWSLARKAAADLGTTVRAQFGAALKAAWAATKAPVVEPWRSSRPASTAPSGAAVRAARRGWPA